MSPSRHSLTQGHSVSDDCAVVMARGCGGKKRTTSADDPPCKETEVVAVDITPPLPAKRARKPSGRKSAAQQEAQRSHQRRATKKAPATPNKESDSAAVTTTESPSKTIMEPPSKIVMESPASAEVLVDKDAGPTTWLTTTATLHERTMLTKASHGRTAPRVK